MHVSCQILSQFHMHAKEQCMFVSHLLTSSQNTEIGVTIHMLGTFCSAIHV